MQHVSIKAGSSQATLKSLENVLLNLFTFIHLLEYDSKSCNFARGCKLIQYLFKTSPSNRAASLQQMILMLINHLIVNNCQID